MKRTRCRSIFLLHESTYTQGRTHAKQHTVEGHKYLRQNHKEKERDSNKLLRTWSPLGRGGGELDWGGTDPMSISFMGVHRNAHILIFIPHMYFMESLW